MAAAFSFCLLTGMGFRPLHIAATVLVASASGLVTAPIYLGINMSKNVLLSFAEGEGFEPPNRFRLPR